jgi:hypothetical protein
MFGIQVFDDYQRDVINFIRPVYILDFFHIGAGTSGKKNYTFEHDMFVIDWISSFGDSLPDASLNVSIDNDTLQWGSSGYSFDIFVFLRAI